MDHFKSFSSLESILWPAKPLQQLFTATLAVSVLLVVLYWGAVKQKDRRRRPPGPRPWPIVGNLPVIGTRAHQDFQKLAKQYGPIFRLRLGSRESYIVSSPKLAEEVLKKNDAAFASRPNLSQFTILGHGRQSVITAPYGPFWRYAKKVFTVELMTSRRIQQFQNVRKEEILRGLHFIIKQCESGKPVRLRKPLKHLSMNNVTRMIVNKAFFGSNSTTDLSEGSAILESCEDLLTLGSAFVVEDYIPLLQPFDLQGYKKRMKGVVKVFDKAFQEIIDERRQRQFPSSEQHAQNEVMDFVDVLLTLPTGTGENPLTDTQIRAILQDVVAAATDTTSGTVEWAMAELLKHPAVLRKAQDELDAVVGQERLVQEEDIVNLKYLRCITREVMRLHPNGPMSIPHECTESREIAGYHIPVNSLMFVNWYAIARDPEVWERPLEFYPERFLSTSIDVHGQDFELLPFGSGRRMCPGKNLGLLLVEYILAVLLHTCDWALPPGVSPQDVDLTEGPEVTLVMVNPLEAIASPRMPKRIIFADQKSLLGTDVAE